jgi:hypothetical protein
MCRSINLVRTLIFSSSSSSLSHLALGMPTFSLLVTRYIGALSLKQPYISNLVLYFCYIKIRYLNSSILSYSFLPIARSLKSFYFLIAVLTF